MYSPQYVVGGPDWGTTLSVVNLDPNPAHVTFRFIGDDGLQIGATRALSIPGRGKIYVTDQKFFLDAGERLTQGYIEILSDNARLTGSVLFGDPQRARFASALPTVSALRTSVVFGQVASGQLGAVDYFTGIAVLNPSDTDARVTIELFDRDGRRVASKDGVIAAHRRKSKLLTQYFENLTGQAINGGYIKVTADRGLAGFALFGAQDLSALSAVPAQAVP